MARRSIDWNDGLAKDLQNMKFAQGFIQSALDEGLSIQQVLGKVIRAYGVKEFSAKAKLPSSNVLRAINPKHNPTLDTMNRLLKPFALQIAVASAVKRQVA